MNKNKINAEDIGAHIKNMKKDELEQLLLGVRLSNICSNFVGVASIFFALVFTNIFTILFTVIVLYFAGNISLVCDAIIWYISVLKQSPNNDK